MLWVIYGSFLACLLVSGFLVKNAFVVSHDRQVAACNRGKLVRANVNELSDAVSDAREILGDSITEAAHVRVVRGDPKGAARRRGAAARLMALHVPRLPEFNCEQELDRVK